MNDLELITGLIKVIENHEAEFGYNYTDEEWDVLLKAYVRVGREIKEEDV